MTSYKLIKETENSFLVLEIATNKVIFRAETHKETNVRYRDLKDKKGFDGWTPDFIMKGEQYVVDSAG